MLKLGSSLVLVIACVACGSSFSANDGGAGSVGLGNAGEASGGQDSSAGSGSGGDASEMGGGGTSSGGDDGSEAGRAGASAGRGGATVGGSGGSAGSSAGTDCARLKAQYQSAVEKARVCDKGSLDQCSASSTVEPLSCGCPVLVNAKSEYTTTAKKARQAFQDAKCAEGVACAAIACAPITEASCAATLSTSTNFVCTAVTALPN
jgi:hypothetical protein